MSEPVSFPPPLSPEIEAAINAGIDRDRLKVLEIAYYIAGGLTIFAVSFLLIHFTVFLVFGLNPQFFAHQNASGNHHDEPPPFFFLGIAGVIGFIILLGWTFGALQIFAGRCLRNRRHHLFILIIAGVECIFIPWGTFLGVCTFIAMESPSMKYLFART